MTIKQNKGQTVLYAFLTLMGMALLFFFVFVDIAGVPHEANIILDNPVIYWAFKLVSLVCGLFCLWGEIYFVRQMFSKEPLVEICDEYFYDNSSAISLGKIKWDDMEIAYVKGGFLNIKLKDPELYFKRKNKLQLMLIKSNIKLGYGDACISPQRLKNKSKVFLDEFAKRKSID